MASANRKSLSLTDVARFNRRFKDYGFAEEAKVKQSYMLTPFDLSECVGPLGSPYPKEPLGPQPGASLFEPPCSFSLGAEGRNKRSPRKASSATVLTSDRKLARKRMQFRRSYFAEKKENSHGSQDNFAVKNDGCIKFKVNSTNKVIKERKSRIPVPIKTLTASKSAKEIKQIVKEKPTVTKRHFCSPNLGRNMPSKIPVRVTKKKRRDSIEKINNEDVTEPFKACYSNDRKIIEKENDSNLKLHQTEKTLHHPTNAAKLCGLIGYHQSSILLLTCETDSSSLSETEADKKKTSGGKSSQVEDVRSSMCESSCDFIISKDSFCKKQEPTIERDSGIVLSRATVLSNQSSLLVMSHDTDCTSYCSSDGELLQASYGNGGPQRVQKEMTTTSSNNDRENEGSLQELNINEKAKHEPTVCTDNHSSHNSLREESSHSVASSTSTQTEKSMDSQEEKYSLCDKEFLRMAKLLNTTVPHLLNLKESGIQKQKIRRRKRAQQHLARTAREVGVLTQQTADQMVSYSLSSSDEEDNELPLTEGTREGVTEFRSYDMENIMLHGQLERLKQMNSALRSNERTLLKKIKNEAAKNELLNSKSDRLRSQVKTFKREMKKTGTKSRQREKALKRIIESQQQKLQSADKLASTLKSCLQESENNASQQTMISIEMDKAMSEQVVKLQQQEVKLAAQRDELQRAERFVSRQKAELQRANEEIEKQKAELRVANEETVKQLKKIQWTLAVLEKQERVFKDAKESFDKRVAKLEEQLANVAQKSAETEEKLQEERRNNIVFQVQITEVKNHLLTSRGFEQQAAKSIRDFELKNQQLSNENKQLREEIGIASLRFKSAESEQQQALVARDTLCKQLEEQVTSLEKQKSELERENTLLLFDLNTPKREESTQALEIITQHSEKHLRPFRARGTHQNNPDADQTGPDVEQRSSEFHSLIACAQSNERNARRFLSLMRECAQLRELLGKFESEHRSLVEKTDGEKEMMRGEIGRLSKESLRKDKELDMMESSLEELGKVKNYEIRDLRQALRRREEECSMVKEELRQKEDKTKIITATQTKTKRQQ